MCSARGPNSQEYTRIHAYSGYTRIRTITNTHEYTPNAHNTLLCIRIGNGGRSYWKRCWFLGRRKVTSCTSLFSVWFRLKHRSAYDMCLLEQQKYGKHHTHIHKKTHTQRNPPTNTHAHKYVETETTRHGHTHIHTRTEIYAATYLNTHILTRAYTLKHMKPHTHIEMQTHKNIQTNTHSKHKDTKHTHTHSHPKKKPHPLT